MRILVIGSGGREHAIAWSLKKSPSNPDVFISPGNGGTHSVGTNVELDLDRFEQVVSFVKDSSIDFVIVGPEQPLVDGLADYLRKNNIPVVGPSAQAARLEGSKAFSKDFMSKYHIPTAAYQTFSAGESEQALAFVRREGAPIVVKASGLAAGKGAIVCGSLEEAEQAIVELMTNRSLGDAADQVVIESFMEGEEVSVFVATDGNSYALLAAAQDHKRIGEGDTGPNTGGMGAYAPAPVFTDQLRQRVLLEIVEPTLEGMKKEGCPFQGFLYVGLMITKDGPKVVEYNCRLGDPETQVVLPLLDTDAVELFKAMAVGELHTVNVSNKNAFSACVVLASGGYPGSYEKGKVISGVEHVSNGPDNLIVFHAGTKREHNTLQTNGGRVLAITGLGSTLEKALNNVYSQLPQIKFDQMQFRRDIGQKGLNR